MLLAGDHWELDWKGREFKQALLEAGVQGVQETMEACVDYARYNHEYEDRSGDMTSSIKVFDRAHPEGPDRVVGSWGADRGRDGRSIAVYLEVGTSRPWSKAPRAEARVEMAAGVYDAILPPQPPGRHTPTRWLKSPGGSVRIPGEGPLMDPHRWMRPAMLAEYPLLMPRIAAAYAERMGG